MPIPPDVRYETINVPRRQIPQDVLVRIFGEDPRHESTQVWIDGWQVPPVMALELEFQQDLEELRSDAGVIGFVRGHQLYVIKAEIRVPEVRFEVVPPNAPNPVEFDLDDEH